MSDHVRYSERILPSLGATAALAALIFSMAFSIWAALGLIIATSFASIATFLGALWWMSAIHRVEVSSDWIRVNEATLQLSYINDVISLDSDAWKLECGINFDPNAFHAHRFWNTSGVKFTLRDQRDPHTSWVIASKDPKALARAIARAIARKE